ncbi:peptidase A24 [Lampropedia cohaerens]|uniref:Peptidase A24 n=1 Tax=Lampropedia cohaerens TaxID=1610491 RepID=A0A0U1Q2L5_9BURK|nr:prepilin peptidase [Lampropedia cohaerens]KKW68988.1 peptidase A24 [Lampropedia cohaerens]
MLWNLTCWLLWLVVIAATDLNIRKVRNWMVLLGLAAGLVALFSGGQPFQVSPWGGLLGMTVAFAALLPFYALGWMGAGDVKFAAVVGLWFGLSPALLVVWLGGSLLAGLHAIAVVGWRVLQCQPLGLWLQAHVPLLARHAAAPGEALNLRFASRHRQRSIPYAGYMALCAIWVAYTTGPTL